MSSHATEVRLPQWTLGDRLRKARELTGMKQKDFAQALGVSRNTVSNYEAEATPMRRPLLIAWAALCDVPTEWLIDGNASFGEAINSDRADAGAQNRKFPNANGALPAAMCGLAA